LRGYNGSVYSVVFTPDGKGLVSGSLDKYEDVQVSGLVVGRGVSAGSSSRESAGGTSQCTMNFKERKSGVFIFIRYHAG
jgi:glucose repression regulatory protein TUP1